MKNMPKVEPINEKILVKRFEADEKSRGGIVIPDCAKERPKRGTIIAIGQGKYLESGARRPFIVKVSDTVLFTSYAGSEVKIDGEDYLLMSEDDILAVIKE